MLVKLLTIAVLLISLVECQYPYVYPAPWENDDPPFRTGFNNAARRCDEPFCGTPCRGAPRPPACPHTMVDCRSQCVCLTDCSTHDTYCFEMKHCIRRFVINQKSDRNVTEIASATNEESDVKGEID